MPAISTVYKDHASGRAMASHGFVLRAFQGCLWPSDLDVQPSMLEDLYLRVVAAEGHRMGISNHGCCQKKQRVGQCRSSLMQAT